MHPKETMADQGLCPQCGKPVTVGVLARVEELADHEDGRKSPRWRPFYSLISLPEVIGEAKGVGPNSQGVQKVFMKMLYKIGNEMFILREAPVDQIKRVAGSLIAEGIKRVREGHVNIAAGYDGEYGKVKIFSPEERQTTKDQLTLFNV